MSSINACTFSGRMGKDAETRFTANQKAVTGFTVAVDIGWGDNKSTMWVDCACWGNRWEKLAPYLKKGTIVVVTGEFSIEEYETRDGQKRSQAKLNVRDVAFAGDRAESKPQPTPGFRSAETKPAAAAPAPVQQSFQPVGEEMADDDIPF